MGDDDPASEALWRLTALESTELKEKWKACRDPAVAGHQDQRQRIVRDYLACLERASLPLPVLAFGPEMEWFNVRTALRSPDHLRGRLTVVDVFTYCCVNCMHVLPDLEAVEDRFDPNSVLVMGVHSAKFDHEKGSDNLLAAIRKYDIRHPVVNDPDATLWNQFFLSCWPTFLVLGPEGTPLVRFVGEGQREDLLDFLEVALDFYGLSGQGVEALPDLQFGLGLRVPGMALWRVHVLKVSPPPAAFSRIFFAFFYMEWPFHFFNMINSAAMLARRHSKRKKFRDMAA